jgi:hypothetical protein
MLKKIKVKTNSFLIDKSYENKEIRTLLNLQFLFLFFVITGLIFLGYVQELPAFMLGALVATFNFLVLARIVPKLIMEQKGSVFSLLISFYLRLFLTALVLFLAIAWAKVNIYPLLAGLSSVIFTVLIWVGKSVFINKIKEA